MVYAVQCFISFTLKSPWRGSCDHFYFHIFSEWNEISNEKMVGVAFVVLCDLIGCVKTSMAFWNGTGSRLQTVKGEELWCSAQGFIFSLWLYLELVINVHIDINCLKPNRASWTSYLRCTYIRRRTFLNSASWLCHQIF